MGDELTLTPDGCALLVIDVQERLIAAMPEPARASVERNLITLEDWQIHGNNQAADNYPKYRHNKWLQQRG